MEVRSSPGAGWRCGGWHCQCYPSLRPSGQARPQACLSGQFGALAAMCHSHCRGPTTVNLKWFQKSLPDRGTWGVVIKAPLQPSIWEF